MDYERKSFETNIFILGDTSLDKSYKSTYGKYVMAVSFPCSLFLVVGGRLLGQAISKMH